MLKHRNAEIALGLLIGIVLSLFFGSVGSYQSAHCVEQKQAVGNSPSEQNKSLETPPNSHDGHEQSSKHGKSEPFDCRVAGLAGATVAYMDSHEGFFVGLFTGCLFIATCLLWRSTERLWEAGEKQFSALNRPRIRMKHVQMTAGFTAGERTEFRIVFVNVGVTDALLRGFGISLHLLEDIRGLPPDPSFRLQAGFSPTSPDRRLRSGITMVVPNLSDGTVFSGDDLDRINMRILKLFCVGFVEYEDSQGGIRKTAFCRVLDTRPASAHRLLKTDDPDYEFED